MKRNARHNGKAFSLIEMVAASTILSLGVITLCSLSVRNVTRIHDNQKEEMAWDILDRQMAMIDYVGIDSFVELGQLEGTLGSGDSPLGEYQWQAALQEGDYIGLYEVTMVISWGSERHKKAISASTMFLGSPAEEEGEDQEQQDDSNSSGQEGASGTSGTNVQSGGGFNPGSINQGGGGPGGGGPGSGGPGGGDSAGGTRPGGGNRPQGRQDGGRTIRPGGAGTTGSARPGSGSARPGRSNTGRSTGSRGGRPGSNRTSGRSSGGGSGG
ncbi:MAG: hypothetical protein JXA82_15345 [Sedimentisphaerales bacterium]|nr:hypothetical protein [Sedimentisphaerales bacterium]